MPRKNILIIIFTLIVIGIFIFLVNLLLNLKRKTPPASLPSGIEPLSEEVIRNLTVPEGAKVEPLTEEVIKKLTVPK